MFSKPKIDMKIIKIAHLADEFSTDALGELLLTFCRIDHQKKTNQLIGKHTFLIIISLYLILFLSSKLVVPGRIAQRIISSGIQKHKSNLHGFPLVQHNYFIFFQDSTCLQEDAAILKI